MGKLSMIRASISQDNSVLTAFIGTNNNLLFILKIRIIETTKDGLYTIPKSDGDMNLFGIYLSNKEKVVTFKDKEPWLHLLFGRNNNIIYMTINQLINEISSNLSSFDRLLLASDIDLNNLIGVSEYLDKYIKALIIDKDIYHEQFIPQYTSILDSINTGKVHFKEDIFKYLYDEEDFYKLIDKTNPLFFSFIYENTLFGEKIILVPVINNSKSKKINLEQQPFKSYMFNSESYKNSVKFIKDLGYVEEDKTSFVKQ